MLLSAGTRLGSYEIVAPIGAGGMGEVYKARDLRLNRFIALKVLPGTAALDTDRRTRFEREARAIAALNHPNIVTLFSVEEHPRPAPHPAPGTPGGVATSAELERDDALLLLTMELVEGHSLAHAIPRTGVPIDRLLKIGIPVAHAIAAAHQKGITHRDLKPANIMLGEGDHAGRVKVLDFGLAKLTAVLPESETATLIPVGADTGAGRILGTVAYMSPEQAEGKPIDSRSDLFSLGVILYEMAIGRRPFTGETSISVISSIVKDTPKVVTEYNAALPRELGRIIKRALVKDPERRYQTAKDLANDLEELKVALDSGELAAQAVSPEPSGRWRRHLQLGLAVAAGAIIALAVVGPMVRRNSGPLIGGSPPTPFQMLPLTITGVAQLPAVSRDGKYVAYVQVETDQHSVWVRQIESNSDLRIVPPVPGQSILGLAITPNTGFVDFVTRTGSQTPALWRVPLLGGPLRSLMDGVPVSSAPGWSPDGKQMAVLAADLLSGTDSVVVATADGSDPRVIARRKEPRMYTSLARVLPQDFRPVWLPDGHSIVVLGRDEAGDLEIVTVNATAGPEGPEGVFPVRGSRDWFPGMGMALASDGRTFILTLARNGGPPQLFSVRPPSTEFTRLTNDLHGYAGVSTAVDVVATAQHGVRSSLWVTDAMGHGVRQVGREVPSELARWGMAWAGERHVIYDAALVGGHGLWSTDVTTGTSQFLVPDARVPSTSADRRMLIFSRGTTSEGWAVWRSNIDGTRPTQIPNAAGFCPSMTPNGSAVLYLSRRSGVQSAWILDLTDGGVPRPFAQAWVNPCGIAVSPDGRFVMLQSRTAGGAPEALIVPIGGGEPVRRLNIGGGPIQWTPDGRALAYLNHDAPSNIWIQPLEGGPPRQLTRFTDQRIIAYRWSQDGKLLTIARATDRSDIVLLKGVQ